MAAQDDLEKLRQQLEEHRRQLADVEQVLQETPNDESLLKLHTDLRKIIALTEDLTKMRGLPSVPVVQDEITWKAGDRCLALYEGS